MVLRLCPGIRCLIRWNCKQHKREWRPASPGWHPGIQVIQRVGAILDAFRGTETSLSLGQLAGETGLTRSTVQRTGQALQDVGWVLLPCRTLEQLSKELNETVDLSIRRYDRALFVDQVTANQRLRAVSAVGETFPLHCSANGKALLATLPGPLDRDHYRPELPRLTDKMITTLPALLEQIAGIRAGISSDREEHTTRICAAGCAVPTSDGRYTAMSVPLPAQRCRATSRG